MKKKSFFSYMFLLILAWTTSCYADNCSKDDWCKMHNPDLQTSDLRAIWGSSKNDVFAVGFNGTILHYDGSNWSEMGMTSLDAYYLHGIWGSNNYDVYAMGSSGTILHYDGSYWSKIVSGTWSRLNGIWGSSGGDVFAVGDDGTILRRNLSGPFKLSVLLSGNGTVTSVPQGIHCPTDCTESYEGKPMLG